MVHNARYDATHGKELKMLTPKEMLQRLPIDLAQVTPGNRSEILINQNRQITYFLHREKEITRKEYNSTMNSISL